MTAGDLDLAGGRIESRGGINYLDDEVASAFFAAREAEAYYRSLKSVDEKRAFHDHLIETLTRLLRAAEGPGAPLLDDLARRHGHGQHRLERVGEPRGRLADPRRSARRAPGSCTPPRRRSSATWRKLELMWPLCSPGADPLRSGGLRGVLMIAETGHDGASFRG